ncbi:MAG TPA: methyltransferase domain-containing protein [Polyangiaceae bacterium]|jgi:SAM-dependent methyltransferase
MTSASIPDDDVRWGGELLARGARDLPGLKYSYLASHLPPRGRVLEVGSGEGKLLRSLHRDAPELELFGCDVRSPATSPDGYEFSIAEGGLPYPSASFDAVIVADVLEHVPDPEHTLLEIARILAPGGRLVAFVPVEGEPLSLYSAYRVLLGPDLYLRTKEHVQAFRHAHLRAMVSAHFETADWRYAYHALGHAFDASFFAVARLPRIREFWWKENKYYRGEQEVGALARALNRLLELGNRIAYYESVLLARTRICAAGVLFDVRKRNSSVVA